jgi:VWFA-related protein
MRHKLLPISALVLSLLVGVHGQTPSPARQLSIDVRVTDKSGAPIRGLVESEFLLLQDNQPQTITAFQEVNASAPAKTDPRVEAILIFDAINSNYTTVSFERTEIRKFLLADSGELAEPVTLVALSNNGPVVLSDSSRDGNALAAVYDKFQTGLREFTRSQGINGAEERFNLSLKAFDQLVDAIAAFPGRKLMIWISPGWPYLSGPGIQFSAKDQDNLFTSIAHDSTRLAESQTTVYSIDPLGSSDSSTNEYFNEFTKGVTEPSRVVASNAALQVHAVHTGGRAIYGTNDLSRAIADCVADAANYYLLTFNEPAGAHPNEYHSLAVRVENGAAVVRTRTGYYAQP